MLHVEHSEGWSVRQERFPGPGERDPGRIKDKKRRNYLPTYVLGEPTPVHLSKPTTHCDPPVVMSLK